VSAPKPAFSTKTISTAPRIVIETDAERILEEIRQCIAARAYQFYEESGRQDGNDQRNWVRAESELLRQDVEVREAGTWISVKAILGDLSADGVEIHLSPDWVIIKAEKQLVQNGIQPQDSQRQQKKFFWVAELPVQVDPSTANASVKEKQLRLMVRKREHLVTSFFTARLSE
jgi:HSP20 family molecular chaperone IbpA